MRVNQTLRAALLLIAVAVTVGAQEHERRQPKPPALPVNAEIVFPAQLGDKLIMIPNPEGFEEAMSQFENFKNRVLATEAPQNDVLVAHLPVSDCELLRKGETPAYNHFTKVSVFRMGRELTMSREAMAVGVNDLRKNFGVYLNPEGSTLKELEAHIERNLTKLDSKETKVDMTKPQLLGEFDIRPDVNSFLMMMTYSVKSGATESSMPMLVTISFVRVKERVIFAYSFQKYRSKEDADSAKRFTTKWTTSILAANK